MAMVPKTPRMDLSLVTNKATLLFVGYRRLPRVPNVPPNVHGEGRALLLRASLSIVGLDGNDPVAAPFCDGLEIRAFRHCVIRSWHGVRTCETTMNARPRNN